MTSAETKLDPALLLTIDVQAEIAKLARAQVDESWQVAVELVRRARLAGARHVEIDTESQRLEVRDDGPAIEGAVLANLACALDPGRTPGDRHAALVELELAGLGLLAGSEGLGIARMLLESGGQRLRWTARHAPIVEPAPPRPGTRIILGGRHDRARTCAALRQACRFSAATIVIDGEVAGIGFDDALAEVPLAPPLDGRLAARRSGEARLWLLVGGIVVTRVSVPSLPPIEAAVEVSGTPAHCSPTAVREVLPSVISLLHAPMLDLVLRLGRNISRHTEPDQRRIRQVLLETARLGFGRSEILRLPLWRTVREGREGWSDLAELARPGHPILALLPGRGAVDYVVSSTAVILDSDERALLAELFGLRFVTPALRRRARGLRERLRETLLRGRDAVGLQLFPQGAPLPESSLSADERGLLTLLRRHLAGVAADVALCPGSHPSALRGDRGRRLLVVGREHAALVAGSRLIARDPAWLYPTLVALLREREGRFDEARPRWRARATLREPATHG